MNVRMLLIVLIAGLIVVSLMRSIQAKSDRPQAELLLVNGRIVTMNAENPTAEAVAVTEGRIIALGTTAEIVMTAAADARIIDLDGTQGAGCRMIANIVDCDPDRVRIGDKVRVVFDHVSDVFALPRFTPV